MRLTRQACSAGQCLCRGLAIPAVGRIGAETLACPKSSLGIGPIERRICVLLRRLEQLAHADDGREGDEQAEEEDRDQAACQLSLFGNEMLEVERALQG